MTPAVTDPEMETLIETCDLDGIRTAAQRDPELIKRGWRDGVVPWIMYSMNYDYCQIVPLLQELGADINAPKGHCPDEDAIGDAVNDADVEALRFLLQHGAKPKKARAVWGAVTAGEHQLEMVRLLEKYGGDIHEVDEGGFSGRYANPLSLALDYELDDVADYLRSRGCVMPPPDEEEIDNSFSSESTSKAIIDHFTNTIGRPEKLALIEIVPTGIPISIHAIPANKQHPYITLFTTGMSDFPMNTPPEARDYSFAEIYIQLPASWKYRDYEDPNWGWPQHWLRSMAQYPQQHDTWLGGPVTLVANKEPPQPLAPNTKFSTLLLFADQSIAMGDGSKIWLYRMTPLYTEERQLEIDQGISTLLNAFDAHHVPMIVDMNRVNVALP